MQQRRAEGVRASQDADGLCASLREKRHLVLHPQLRTEHLAGALGCILAEPAVDRIARVLPQQRETQLDYRDEVVRRCGSDGQRALDARRHWSYS
jgi:hypothetical protein